MNSFGELVEVLRADASHVARSNLEWIFAARDGIAHLHDLDLKGLRAQWQSIFQRPPPPTRISTDQGLDQEFNSLEPGISLYLSQHGTSKASLSPT